LSSVFYRKEFFFPHGQHAACGMPTNFSSTASVIFHNPFLAKYGLDALGSLAESSLFQGCNELSSLADQTAAI
jgi:hypothetical protein